VKAAEVRKLSDEELAVEIDRLQRRVFDLRCAVVTEKIEDPSLFPKLRRDIARLKTERRSRELASQTEKANA
jgi:large subunit ribosomal protein L29